MSLAGHYWTIAPSLRHRMFPRRAPAAEPWRVDFQTRFGGHPVRLQGRWREEPDSDVALLVVHGLGGTYDRQYCVGMAREAARRGWSCLRLALRGADREGTDFYHAGLTEDLEAAWSHRCLQRFRTIHLVGFSLGGHLLLRFVAEGRRDRMGTVMAVCAPLDLDYCATHLDEHASAVYRQHVLGGLNEIYASIASVAAVPTPVERMRRVRKIREWDSLSIVPRYGFRDVQEYYESESVVRRIDEIEGPTVIVASEADPMIPFDHVVEARKRNPERIQWVFTKHGGHVGFPPRMSFDQPGARGWPAQLGELLSSPRMR